MSSLVHLPSGATFDYWWERMRGRAGRKRFLLTKVLEVITYNTSKTGQNTSSATQINSVLELPPRILRNGVKPQSKVMVVIPAKCSTERQVLSLQRLVGALSGQRADIVVVNDGSTLWPRLPASVKVLTLPQSRGPAAARNRGVDVALASGSELVLFIDSDCIPDSNWVSESVLGFTENPYVHCISDRTNSSDTTWFDRYHEFNGTLNGRKFKGSQILLYGPTCNLAITRELAETIKFDESFPDAACEDIDFCFRLIHHGFRTVHRPSMVVSHDYHYQSGRWLQNAWHFVRQFRKYAKAESILLRNYPDYYAYFGQTEEISSLIGSSSKVSEVTVNNLW